MPIFALWKAEEKFFIRTADNAVQTADVQSIIQMAADGIIVLSDLKKLLRSHPEFSQVPLKSFFDVKLANSLCNGDGDGDSAVEIAQNLKLPEITDEGEALLKLYEFFKDQAAENKVYNDIELPLAPVLAAMERRGILLDKAGLIEFGEKLKKEISEAEKTIFTLAKKEFNINSTKQLSQLLFEELQLPAVGKKTQSGYSTDAEALEKIIDSHPIVSAILNYRKLSKVNSTYVEGLLKYCTDENRIHTTFNMTATATGRLSSTEPNLQNLPVAGELGGEVRKFFHPPAGSVFIDADYSQIELRILAHIANDPEMIKAFCNHEDIHAVTASWIFGVEQSDVTREMRRQAKAVNFGIVYGISPFTLANDLNIEQSEAKKYIESYFEKYSAVKIYLDNTVKEAKKNGYVETLSGRRRMIPELKSKNFAVRAFGERVAKNMPIQGTAADLMLTAMIKVDSELKKAGLHAELLLQIHDELLLCCPENEVEAAQKILQEFMESAMHLSVPLEVSMAVGKNYIEVK